MGPRAPQFERMANLFLFGSDQQPAATNDLRSFRENIWYASCVASWNDIHGSAESEGNAAIQRMSERTERSCLRFITVGFPVISNGELPGGVRRPAKSIHTAVPAYG
jgi:hypothetical protein